jgi:1,4-dihydroxy-2-naphthoate polyprenyltransferase
MEQRPDFLKTWLTACRPWSWPASVVPVLFGTALAVRDGAEFSFSLFAAALLAMATLHSAANIYSDAADLEKGLDKLGEITPVTGAVARGWLTPPEARRGAYALFAAGALLGLALVPLTGADLLWIGGAGFLVGFFYSQLKYRAFGDLAVFLNFGPLATAGAWTVQTGSFALTPAAWAVPAGLIVIAILHANNWRDMQSDRAGGISTMAGLLGDRGSMIYYSLLLGLPFAYTLAGVLLSKAGYGPDMPWTVLLVFAALPMALGRIKRAQLRRSPARPLDFITLDGATAQLNLLFGLLATAGLLLGNWLGL